MIKNVLRHKSCVRVQYSEGTGDNAVETITLPMLRASSLLITSGATLAEQKVHWMRSFEDVQKRIGTGAEALEAVVLDAEWYLNTQVRINPDKLLKALGFPTGDYVIRRSTPTDRLLVQLLPNRILKTQHIQQLCQQLLYVQEEFSEVRFDIIEQAAATAFTAMYPSTSAAYLEAQPDALVPVETPIESHTEHNTESVSTDLSTDPKAWLGKKRPQSDYKVSVLESLGYEQGLAGYTGKEPTQVIDGQQYDALGFLLNEAGEIGVDS